MYNFDKEKKQEFLQGKTIVYLSSETGISSPFLNNILLGKNKCSEKIAILLCKTQSKDIDDYFIKV